MDPYYIQGMLGGVFKGKVFLGMADLYGNYFEADHFASGFLRNLSDILVEQGYREDMSYEEAKDLIVRCFKVSYAKDKNAVNEVMIAY